MSVINSSTQSYTLIIPYFRTIHIQSVVIFSPCCAIVKAHATQGCASDIPTHWYSLSTDLNPYWNQTHVLQPELKAYWKQLAIKYSLYDHIVLNTRVVAVEWSAQDQKYKVELRDLKNDQVSVEYAEVVISALGALCIPYSPPELKAEVFKGHQFHSARWDHNYDLHGKRVAVIGNGCSA